MYLTGRHDTFSCHPILERFVQAATDRALPGCLPLLSPLTELTGHTVLTIEQRIKRTDSASGFQITLLGPLLPLLYWPAPRQPPTGLPMMQIALPDELLERELSAELLRHAKLSPLGPVPEWARQILNDALTPAARSRLFGRSSKLSQQQFASWFGLSRAQLAHQAIQLVPTQAMAESQANSREPEFFQEWQAEHPDN